MKKLLNIIVLLLVLYQSKAQVPVALPYANAPATIANLSNYTFYIDSISGPSQVSATAVSITDNGTISVNLGATPDGVHQLYVTVTNANGIKSLLNVLSFYKDGTGTAFANTPNLPTNLWQYKFYIDSINGPLQNLATAMATIDNGTQTVNLNVTSSGVHQLYASVENVIGQKSLLNILSFYKDGTATAFANAPIAVTNLSNYEFYIDSINGPVQILPTANSTTDNSAQTVNLGATTSGVHQLYAIAKNTAQIKSLVNVLSFYKEGIGSAFANAPVAANPISEIEYYFNDDPGFGNGTALQITPGNNITLPDSILQVPSGLIAGTNYLHVRTKQNPWSLNSSKPVLIYVSPFAVTPSAINYGSVAIGYTKVDSVVIKNVSTTTRMVNSITMAGPFTSSFTSAVSLAANESFKVYFTFTPTSQLFYSNSITINTSAGTETVSLQGSGVPPAPSWILTPAVGINFGTVAVNNTSTQFFSLKNTGNTPIVLSSDAIQGSTAFVDSVYITTIPIGITTSVRIKFTPPAVGFYDGKLVVKSSTPGLDSTFAVVTGQGNIPGAPPTLHYESATPYNALRGVDPEAGLPGLYTYKIVYKSVNNLPPLVGFPKVGIDRNHDLDFLDLNEGEFTMTKEGTSIDYINGVTYTYSINYPNYTNLLGYKFTARDQNGNVATSVNTIYVNGPVITNQILDLRIFANNISFSNTNPDPNEIFTVFATVENSSPFSASNIPLRYYKDSVLIGLDTLAYVPPYGSGTKSKNFSFPVDGYYPIKVWIDSSNTLNDQNLLNNYAIRPLIVGIFSLPGGINATTTVSNTLYCPTRIVISGTAQYYGTSYPVQPMVSGGQVQIIRGLDTFYTTTNVNGQYNYILATTEGNTETYKVNITDFSLTSDFATNSFVVPFNPSTCGSGGGGGGSGSGGGGGGGGSSIGNPSGSGIPCQNVNGNSTNINVSISYRSKNANNAWNSNDKILTDTVRLFQNGVQVYQQIFADGPSRIGNTYNLTIPVSLNVIGNIDFIFVHKYVYNEFFQAPSASPLYNGVFTQFNDSASTSIYATPNLPDVSVSSVTRTGLDRVLKITNKNIGCGIANSHVVKIYDSIPNGTYTEVFANTTSFLNPLEVKEINYDFSGLAYGYHYLKIVTDANTQLTESNETNNSLLYALYYAAPDLIIDSVKASNNNLPNGTSVNFRAHIKNVKTYAGTFKVSFKANGVLIGSKKVVSSLDYDERITIFSDPYTVSTGDSACPIAIQVEVDCDNELIEENESNNLDTFYLGSDIRPYAKDTMFGTITKPFIVVKDIFSKIDVPIRNMGTRGVSNVNVSYRLSGQTIGSDVVPFVIADSTQFANSGFYHTFNAIGDYVLQIVADTNNVRCEIDETNNTQPFYVKVITGMSDYSVLSQYISPTNLNPNPGQAITFVGTVKNIGNKISEANVLRLLVDDVQIGADIPINPIYPGLDTTVAFGSNYSSSMVGVKIVKLVADVNNLEAEHREDNNLATRTIIVGNAPDFARSQLQGITFNPAGFNAGDSVTINYRVRNYGGDGGTAWLRYIIKDTLGNTLGIDSCIFTIGAIDSMVVSKKMKFTTAFGKVYTEIVRSNPPEFNILNNVDSINFGKIYMLNQAITINSDFDLKIPNVNIFPGWIGGNIVLGNNDLTINGKFINADSSHFIITNGTGKLKIVSSNAVDSFPVGIDINKPNFAVINNTGTPDHFSVRVNEGVNLDGNSGALITTGNVNRTWNIEEEVPGGSDATLTFNWKESDEQFDFDRTACNVAHYIGTQWFYSSQTNAISDFPNFWKQTLTNVNSFSPFIVTKNTGAVLPLTLISFNAIKNDNSVKLNWTTENETALDLFDIEHSENGLTFKKIGFVQANNIFNNTNHYQFLHANPNQGFNFYRLKMVDLNGQYRYSKLAKIFYSKNIKQTIIAPNPVKDILTIVEPKTVYVKSIAVFDMQGKLLLQKQIAANVQVFSLPVTNLSSGKYILKIEYDNVIHSHSIIKQ